MAGICSPLIALEFVSGDGFEERDNTPITGKYWVYEQAIRIPFYGIYEVEKAQVEVYHLVDGRYERVRANERSHYSIPPMNIELGIWQGQYENIELPWLRWWDSEGNLLLTGDERSQQLESQLQQERQRAERLAERLRQLGVNPDEV